MSSPDLSTRPSRPYRVSDDRPKAALVCIGTELTEGSIQDTHIRRFAGFFSELGVDLRSALVLPDDYDLLVHEVARLAPAVDLLVLTGGLGPTSDDLTREVVAAVADRPLVHHDETWQRLLAWGRRLERSIAESNRKQALVPQGFSVVENPVGTAPGFYGDLSGTLLFCFPGPPSELGPMLDGAFRDLLSRRFGVAAPSDLLRFSVYLIGESELEDRLRAFAQEESSGVGGLSWGTRVEAHRILVTLRSGAPELRRRAVRMLESMYGRRRVVVGDRDSADVCLEELRRRDLTAVTAESCTGGGIAARLTSIAGSSTSVWGAFVTYANEAKTMLLGVDPDLIKEKGAVSREVVLAMASGALNASPADLAIAVSGIAGPEGGTVQKPVGTVWIAWVRRGYKPLALRYLFPGDRDAVRRRAADAAIVGMCIYLDKTDSQDSDVS